MTQDYKIEEGYLKNTNSSIKNVLQLVLEKYNNSNDQNILQDGVQVSFVGIANALNVSKADLPDTVFKLLDAQKNEYNHEERTYVPLVQSVEADEDNQEFHITLNPSIFL